MPTYPVTLPDGRILPVTGDSPPTEQELEQIYAGLPQASTRTADKIARDEALAQQEALAQGFIQQQQAPALEKLIQGSLGAAKAIVQPFASIVKGIGGLPEIANEPSRIFPTAAESGRRLGMDIVGLAKAAGEGVLSRIKDQGLLGMSPLPLPMILNQIGKLAPRTPSEQEVQTFLSEQPLQQAIQEERQKIGFKGAQPELAEAITQAVELAPPIKGVQALKGVSLAKASPARILRAATKPGKQFGARFEKSAENTIDEIFNSNPNADKMASMPFEGFQQSVASIQKQVGAQIDDGLKASGIPINAGDTMAAALNARADKLVKAGQPAQSVQALRDRAADLAGQVTDMESLREAVTSANRSNTPLFQRSREAANPLLAQGDTIANQIIAQVGGEVENRALASVQGPQGAVLRKKWADLNLINQEASKRLNTLINSAPPEIQSALAGSLTSLEGAAGLVGLVNGYASGIIPVATAAAKSWVKNSNKLLKDSNALVTSAYDKLRANPPAAPTVTPPPFVYNPSVIPPPRPAISPQATLNAQIAKSLSGGAQSLPARGTGPLLGATPTIPAPLPSIPTGVVPSPQQLEQVIQRLLEEQAAQKASAAQGSTLGFF